MRTLHFYWDVGGCQGFVVAGTELPGGHPVCTVCTLTCITHCMFWVSPDTTLCGWLGSKHMLRWLHVWLFFLFLFLYNNSNYRELVTERPRRLKALYNLKKNIRRANTHNYTNQWYTSVQNIRKLTFLYKAWQKQAHTRLHAHACMYTHTHTHTHTHTQWQ